MGSSGRRSSREKRSRKPYLCLVLHDEVFEAGDAFYLPPGHIPVIDAGCEYLQFSPAEPLRVLSENMMRNFQQMNHDAD